MLKIKIITFIILGILLSFPVLAAELYLKSSQSIYYPNEVFKTEVRLNSQSGENITAIAANIQYNPSDLKFVEFLDGNSILTFIDKPQLSQEGIISFSGIIPGGYSGRLPGDPGESNLLGTIVFQALKTPHKQTTIKILNNSQLLINEGQYAINPIFSSLDINIYPQEVVFNPLNELEQTQEADRIPPEEFHPEIIEINNQNYLIFNTQDKQSGIDHYEIVFLKPNIFGLLRPIDSIKNATSPYPLSETDLKYSFEVKAIDKNGNIRIARVSPLIVMPWYQKYLIWVIIISVPLIIFIAFIISKWLKRKKS